MTLAVFLAALPFNMLINALALGSATLLCIGSSDRGSRSGADAAATASSTTSAAAANAASASGSSSSSGDAADASSSGASEGGAASGPDAGAGAGTAAPAAAEAAPAGGGLFGAIRATFGGAFGALRRLLRSGALPRVWRTELLFNAHALPLQVRHCGILRVCALPTLSHVLRTPPDMCFLRYIDSILASVPKSCQPASLSGHQPGVRHSASRSSTLF